MSIQDSFASGAAYEPYVGRWSRLVARAFVAWLEIPPASIWLDVGCGTGALTNAVLLHADPAEVTGIDPADDFVAYARKHVEDNRASFRLGDALALPFESETFDAAVSGLALNFVPDPLKAVTEMVRVVKHGGAVAAYVWDYAGEMQMMRAFWDAAVELDPEAAEQDEGSRFPICQPEPLGELFERADLDRVSIAATNVNTHFRDFDDYWSPFLGGQGPAPGYVIRLTEEKRAALRERIRANLPVASDGSIALTARAWTVRGRKPY